MRRALECGQGFDEGTFVIHGSGASRLYDALKPHAYLRSSSHFSMVRVEDPERIESAESSHIGIDVEQDGSHDLPAQKQTVLLGKVRMHDGSVGVFVKPESHGCNVSRDLAGAIAHGAQYISSQIQRRCGDSRSHDEGRFKRKEYVPTSFAQTFHALIDELTGMEELKRLSDDVSLKKYGLGEMAKQLRQKCKSLRSWCSQAESAVQKMEDTYGMPYGSSLNLRFGHEVSLQTSMFEI